MKNVALFLFVLAAAESACQTGQSELFKAGFVLGLDVQNMGAAYIQEPRPDYPYGATGRPTAGFGAGVFGMWRLSRQVAIRQQVLFGYNRNDIKVLEENKPERRVRYTFYDLEIPLHLVLTNRARRFPPATSLFFGPRIGINMASLPTEAPVGVYRARYALDLGMGIEFKRGKWRIKPELLYSHGLNNLHEVGDRPLDWAIGRIVRDKLCLRVLFWR